MMDINLLTTKSKLAKVFLFFFLWPLVLIPLAEAHTVVPDMGPENYGETLSQSREATITGKVTDENGEPLPGVTVSVEGSLTGTVTDLEGNYSLTVPEGSVLTFSFIGYSTQRISVGKQTVINASLVPDVQALSEVVVTAFGIEKEKKALSYAVQEISGDRLAAVGNTNLTNSLQGKV